MPQRPDYVSYAFEQLGYEDFGEKVQSFTSQWGGLELETFARVLKEGQAEEKVLALFALGSTTSLWAHELLLPFLQSVQPMERWASALCLGRTREEQAFPILINMLTEFFPPKEWSTFIGDGLWLYNNRRLEAILLLAEGARPETVTHCQVY